MSKTKMKIVFAVIALGFFIIGFGTINKYSPEDKEVRIFNDIKQHIPFHVDYKMSKGFFIVNSKTLEEINLPNKEVYQKLDELEKLWGKTHLRINGNFVEILDDNAEVIAKVIIDNEKELMFVKRFFGI